MLTRRDNYGYPIEYRRLQAQFYAADVRERKRNHARYEEIEKLQAVMNIMQAYEEAKRKK